MIFILIMKSNHVRVTNRNRHDVHHGLIFPACYLSQAPAEILSNTHSLSHLHNISDHLLSDQFAYHREQRSFFTLKKLWFRTSPGKKGKCELLHFRVSCQPNPKLVLAQGKSLNASHRKTWQCKHAISK